MKINSISMNNFHCYYGDSNIFEFSEGLNIVLGPNGYGKSKLYDAFQWVLTNQITDNDPNNRAGYKPTSLLKRELISEKALIECTIGESVECKVSLEVEHVNGANFQLVRSYTTTRSDEKNWFDSKDSKFTIYQRDIIHFKPIPEGEHARVLESLIPVDVRPYVWFQGERGVNSLIDTSSDDSLKVVIRRLSDIDKWDKYIAISKKAYDSAQNAFDQALRASKKNQDKVIGLQADQAAILRAISALETQIEETQRNLKGATEKNDALAISLENAQNLNQLRADEESVSREIKLLGDEIDHFYLSFNKKMFSNYWVLSSTENQIETFEQKYQEYSNKMLERKAMELSKKAISKKIQTRLPDGVPEPMHIKNMLDAQRCLVCNREAPEGSDPYLAIKELLSVDAPLSNDKPFRPSQDPLLKQIYHNALVLKGNILNTENEIKDALKHVSELTNRKKQLEQDLEAKGKEIQEQLRISGIINPKHIIDSFRMSAADIKTYGVQLGNFEKDREIRQKELKNINAELGKLSEGEVETHLTQKRNILEDFAELTKRIKNDKYRELIKLLENKANEHYKNINEPTGAFYGKIKFSETVDSGYRPCIVDPAKGDADVTSSSNTSLISSMKLAIIMAIVTANKLRNYQNLYPLISDAPVSDFDVIKTKTFLLEASQTFNQSVIIMYKYLEEDETKEGKYSVDTEKIRELSNEVKQAGKKLTVYQLDMPKGVSNKFRNEIQVKIKKVS